MKLTPLPLTVWAITQVGLPAWCGTVARAASMAATSWPSISLAAQPNDDHLAAKGSRSSTSLQRPRL